ncbi:DMT family transporter [Phenylobacterium sp.]|uniref:DMT family transporter n=1 Tax=Phenylobacterium sp. TaxID=1871053 RepID=UPI002736EA36|nr:DMT family transporter [Phenylobacterium sp.]MDP3634667.1 DMT family transporter [Phenylobacterium sp.]MDP3870887.1 DMT family transporter [Phenylobacterium sp.]
MTRPKPIDWLVLAALVVTWGSAFAALKIAVAHIPPFWNTALRLWIAVATLGLVLAVQRQGLPGWRDPAWRFYAFNGLVGMAAPFALFALAAERLPSAINAICNGASPIFTALLAHAFVSGERLTARKAGGVGLGFVGLLVLVGPRLTGGLSLEALAVIGALAGAALYAVSNVVTKRAPPVPSSVGALMMCAWGAVFATAAAVFTGPFPAWPPMSAVLAVTAQGVFPTALATIGYVYLIQRRGPLFLSMAIYMAPLWATVVGVLFLAERLNWTAFAALALILGGVALATLEPRRAGAPAAT